MDKNTAHSTVNAARGSIRAFAHAVVAEFDRLFNSADRESPYRQPTVHHPQHVLTAVARWLKPKNRYPAPFTASPKQLR